MIRRKKPPRIRVIVPEIRNAAEFTAFCATTPNEKKAARITRPVYLDDNTNYSIGNVSTQAQYVRLKCEGSGALIWPGNVNTNLKRILVYARRFRFENLDMSGYEGLNAMIKIIEVSPMTFPIVEGIFKDCYFHDYCTLKGADQDHHSAAVQGGELNSATILFEDCNFDNNAQGNAQYSHPIYLSPAANLTIRNCTFNNSGSLALQKFDGIPEANCEVTGCTFSQSGSPSWWWWTSATVGETRAYAYNNLVLKNSNYNIHHNTFGGKYQEMVDGYFQDLITYSIQFNNNTYNHELADINRFAKQQGGSTYSEATWKSTFGFDANSTFNLTQIPT